MRNSLELENEACDILSAAVRDYGPAAIFSMLSGGNDSRATAYVAAGFFRLRPFWKGAALIDTGIRLQAAHDNVRAFSEWLRIPLSVYKTPLNYRDIVLKYGFPGPAQHSRMYFQLKERAVRILTRENKPLRRSKVMLVSGVRQQESKRRMLLTDPVTVDGARVWVNPLFYWSTEERDEYMRAKCIPRNPISEIICGSSGDCLCGAMADPDGEGELWLLRQFFPEAAEEIEELQREAEAAGVWAKWGCKPPGKVAKNPMAPLFMCVGCEARADGE